MTVDRCVSGIDGDIKFISPKFILWIVSQASGAVDKTIG